MAWTPILEGPLREQALRRVEAIAAALLASPWDGNASLGRGAAGQALFFAQLEREDEALRLLEEALDQPSAPLESLHGGGLGAAWVLEHFRRVWLDTDGDPHVELAALLRTRLRGCRVHGLSEGLAGVGIFALERADAGLMEAVVEALDALAMKDDEGICWFTSPEQLSEHQRRATPLGLVDLGLAHGQAGVIAVLSAVQSPRAQRLLEGAVIWLLAQKLKDAISDYPSWTAPGVASRPSRLGWCYGDLGIALALLDAAKAMGRGDWEAEALGSARRAALRVDGGMEDAALCHGFAGVGHLFNRLHQATGEAVFLDAARRNIARALMEPDREGMGLVEGAAGLGLALLAAATAREPDWDRVLGVSPASPR